MKPKKFKFSTPQEAAMEVADEFVKPSSLQRDTQGWYTGTSEYPDEIPIQDHDDL